MDPLATAPDAWDPDPWLLGCANGVVELRTGILREGWPEEMISRSTGIAYDSDAACRRWMQFLGEVFAGDEELVSWYGLLIGTSLVGVVQEMIAIHHGLGNKRQVGRRQCPAPRLRRLRRHHSRRDARQCEAICR